MFLLLNHNTNITFEIIYNLFTKYKIYCVYGFNLEQ